VTAALVFGGLMLGCVWVGVVTALAVRATDNGNWLLGALAAAALCLPIAIFIGMDIDSRRDPHAYDLCLSGYQVWQSRYRPAALVGKIIMPGGTMTSKVWVCTQWESK
jgi:hypothetical protein